MTVARKVAAARPGATRARARRWSHALHRIFGLDLVLLHAPSVWDFRKEIILQGPVADVVPSTDEFEMYPVGLTSIAGYLEANNYNTRIVNLAYRMLRDPDFDVAAHLAGLRAPVFGIDLHWLPHAHGALGIAGLVKQIHPEAKVLIGGLSASYFHEELIRHPAVDFVLRGDSTEEPCRQLLHALRSGGPLASVENLTWKRPDGSVVVNPLTFVPADLDWVDVPAYEFMLRAVFKYRGVSDFLPYLDWLAYPSTMLLNARGCPLECAVCGGSRSAYRVVAGRSRRALRSPEKLVEDAKLVATFSRAPIFMVHDPRVGGSVRARRFFDLFRAAHIRNELVVEIFYPAGPAFFEMVRDATAAWSAEMTIESPDAAIRRVNGKFPYSDRDVEETIAAALDHGCRKLDLFFMVGLPFQTRERALATIDYCRHLVDRFGADKRLQFYAAPLGPFLDPGCRAFEEAALGYHRRLVTLEDHRRALLGPTWREMLSYETEWMSRDEIVATTYDLAEGLNDLKLSAGLIDAATHRTVADHLAVARRVLGDVQVAADLPEAERQERLLQLQAQVGKANTATLCGKDELKWHSRTGIAVTALLARHLVASLPRELVRGIFRLRGRYDIAVAEVTRLPPPLSHPRPRAAVAQPACAQVANAPD